MRMTAPSASLLTLVGVASRFSSRPVVDATGIDGEYDFSLTFAAETDAGLPQRKDAYGELSLVAAESRQHMRGFRAGYPDRQK